MVNEFLYPYDLEVLEKPTSARNNNGNFVNTANNYVCIGKCRSEKTAANRVIVIGERTRTRATSIAIYCPKGTEALKAGTQVRVVECGEVRVSGQVVESEANRLHTVLYL